MKLSILSLLTTVITLTHLLETEGAGLRALAKKTTESDTTRALGKNYIFDSYIIDPDL